MNELKVPLSKPCFDFEEVKSILQPFKTGWVSDGPLVKEFEDKFAKYLGVEHSVAVSSCTAGLHLSLLALGIGGGDEVIVPDFTHPSTGHSVFYVGATPILVDIDVNTFNIDVSKIEDAVTKKTKAIVPVHLFGNPANMGAIMEIAESRDLKVVEDAACAHGAEYDGKKIGGIGDLTCFSFHGRKILTTGEGGMITTNDGELAEKLKLLRSHGMSIPAWKREDEFQLAGFVERGYNYRLSDIQAAVGLVQLKKLDDFVKERRKLAKHYNYMLEYMPFQTPVVEEKGKHSYQSYVVLLDPKINRNEKIIELRKRGVGCQIGTYSLHMQKTFPKQKGKFKNSLEAFERSLAIPMYNGMHEEHFYKVFEEIDEVFP